MTLNQLNKYSLSLNHQELSEIISTQKNILIIQDLDGVCMGLVKDPLTRIIDPEYVKAVQILNGHFYVLTNGEHIGKRGVKHIVERAFNDVNYVTNQGLYLPGLGAGGVQYQDCYGNVEHPGVSDGELEFLAAVPAKIKQTLETFCSTHNLDLDDKIIEACINASVLDNMASPTANLNYFYDHLTNKPELYLALQKQMQSLMEKLLNEAENIGLNGSFFIHYAPNLGRDEHGQEIMRPVQGNDSGTTDFQFMLQGAIKEAGVLVLLNRYYYEKTGKYPLGKDFNVRKTSKNIAELLQLVKDNFDPELMPLIIGVGDTVNTTVTENNGQLEVKRGGSDRNFLYLVQEIGKIFNIPNVVVYIDSSQGEVKNRKAVKVAEVNGQLQIIETPLDERDKDEPLTLNIVFPEGYQQYCQFFIETATKRLKLKHDLKNNGNNNNKNMTT